MIVAPPNHFTLDFTRNPASGIATNTRDNAAYAWAGHYAVNRNYTTDGLNRYSAISSLTPNPAYDANGNLTSAGGATYTYDVENRLVAATGGVTLTYDPLGRLSQIATSGGATRRFGYDGDALIDEFDGAGNVRRVYVHGPGVDEPMFWWDIPAATWGTLQADERGSIVAVVNAGGAAATINRYDEYGIPGASNAGAFQYTGQVWLPELGMYYYKARVYSPYLGRFLQTDPIGYDGGVNLYAYVDNDPANASDPSGTYKCQGSAEDCRKIDGYANAIRNAAAEARRETGTRIASTSARALSSLSRAIGERNTANGVTIVSADLPDTVLGEHSPGPNGSTIIRMDIANIEDDNGRTSTGAGTLAHEASHGAQEHSAGQPRTLREVFDREVEANVMESLTNQYLNERSSVWWPGIPHRERIRRIRGSAFMSCDYVHQIYGSRFRGQRCPRQ